MLELPRRASSCIHMLVPCVREGRRQNCCCLRTDGGDFKEVSSSPAGITAEEIEEYENQNNIVLFSSSASTDEETQSKLKAFNDWFEASGASPSFLKAELLPVYRIGTKVTQSVKLGDTYLGSYYYLHFSS